MIIIILSIILLAIPTFLVWNYQAKKDDDLEACQDGEFYKFRKLKREFRRLKK